MFATCESCAKTAHHDSTTASSSMESLTTFAAAFVASTANPFGRDEVQFGSLRARLESYVAPVVAMNSQQSNSSKGSCVLCTAGNSVFSVLRLVRTTPRRNRSMAPNEPQRGNGG